MKKLLLLGLLALALCSCGRKTIIGVSFPEAPIEIATNSDFGMQLINMYNIIRTPDGTYRMYFIANPADGIAEHEDMQNLYLAESSDGFHYELKGKLKDYKILVHSVKSASKTIGAMDLFEQTKALEFAAGEENKEYVKENHEIVMEQYRQLAEKLKAIVEG